MHSDDSSNKGDGSSSDLNLVFGDPLYLHPNDTNGTPITTVKLTGTKNYKVWGIVITIALRNHNKIRFIDGTCEKDNTNPALSNQWDMCNSIVFTWILNSRSSDLYAGAIYAKFAYELWNDLKDTYDKVDGSAFDVMVSLPACTCDVAEHYEKHNQLIKLMQFLMGLDENYLAIRSNILTREPLPLVKDAFAIASGEESHRNITSNNSTKPTATAFVAKTFDKRGLITITIIEIGHTMDKCFEIVGYPASYVNINFNSNFRPVTSNNSTDDPHSNNASSSTTSNSPVSLSNEQLTMLMNLLNDNEVSTANANILGWIVDSRANQHMTVSVNFLINVVDISNLGLIVDHPNGTQALITKIGDLKINNNITLYDVLVVREYIVSLLSVYKLLRDNKLFVGFNESNCYIHDLKANKTVGIGRKFNGLYLFDVDNICKIVSSSYISTCFVSKTLWHQRLGHLADQVLDALKTSLNLDSHSTSDHLCDTCNKAKQTREPFPLSDHKSRKIGELVHLDVWGPYKITSKDGFSPDVNQGNDDSEATSMDEINNTHPEGTVPNETDFINDFYENSEFNSDVEELPINTLSKSSRQTKLSTSLNDFIIEGKPTCYEEAILDSNLIDAMNAEIKALNENHIWIIVDLPANRKAIGNKCVIVLSVTNNWPLFQLDVNNAYLYGDLDEDIYMTIPKGFASKDNKNKENDFVQYANDHSLFTKSKNNKFIALLVYVDDIVVTGNCVNEIDKFKIFLKSKFKIKDLRHLKYFLGIEVIKSDKDLCLSQRKYCLELLKDYGLLGCKPVSTPIEPNSVLPYVPTKDDPFSDNITGYQKLLGKLIYLTHTRPNIAYSVHCQAQYMHSPLKSHLNCALNVMRYLKGVPGKGMEEQFVLRVPPSVAERIERLLNESADEESLDLSISEDGRSGKFVIGDEQFSASLFDLPTILESYKTYDDSVLIKTTDVGQMILVSEEAVPVPNSGEYRHGITPPMKDVRRRRFRREPDLNPELVQRVEKDLMNIMHGGTAEYQDEAGDGNVRDSMNKATPAPPTDPNTSQPANAREPERTDSDESDYSI
ncbi:ribonuclease H-like domain-containing protein [Tanacetum coccineum]